MDAATIAILAELVKMGVSGISTYLKEKGATDEQIESMFTDAVSEMLARNPDNIPDTV
jgi:hypothetical protein